MTCKNCGTQNPEKAAFCRKCGTRLSVSPKPSVNPVNPTPRTRPSTPRPSTSKATTGSQNRSPRRRPLVLTTRKTSQGYLVSNLVSTILVFGGIAVFFFKRGADLIDTYWYREEGETARIIATMSLIWCLLEVLYYVMVSRAFADVFTDRIVGMGMQGIQCKSFDLRFNQITGISVSKGFLNIESGNGAFLVINTSAGNYKIITTTARAKEITDYYSSLVTR